MLALPLAQLKQVAASLDEGSERCYNSQVGILLVLPRSYVAGYRTTSLTVNRHSDCYLHHPPATSLLRQLSQPDLVSTHHLLLV